VSNLAKLQALQRSDKDKRQDTWNLIKQKDSQLADWLLEMNKAFGEHKAMTLELDGEVLINKGHEQGVRDMSVKLSLRRW
jgi:hypothetical protein